MKRAANQFFLLFFMWIFYSFGWACSQPKSIIGETYGYYSERQPGNIPVDASGNPLSGFGVDTIFTLYVISSGKDLKWDTAWAGNKVFTIVATGLPDTVLVAGIEKVANQTSVIKAGKGQVIWRLDLVPLDPLPEQPGPFRRGVLIKGEKAGKPFEIQFDELVELRVPASV